MPEGDPRPTSSTKGEVIRQLIAVAKPYWTSEVKWAAFGLLGAIILLLFAVNGLNVVINMVGGQFMTALSGKDQPTFYRMLWIYFAVFVVGTPIVVLYSWVTEKLGLHWRTWLTEHMLQKYLKDRSYYRINNDHAIDNPDERLAQDVRDFTKTALSLMLNLLSSVVTLLSFMAILWSISRELVGIVYGYAIVGTIVTVLLGRRLVPLKFEQLKREANFRYSLIHVRNNVESIAFYRGEEQEAKHIKQRFAEAISNFNAVIGWQRNVGFFTTSYNYLIVLIPSIVIAPLYFHGKVEFGAQTQADMAFAQILASLSLVVSSFDDITQFVAQSKRLGTFNDALEARKQCERVIATDEANEIKVSDLTLMTPEARHTLVKNLSMSVDPGTGLLIMGPSGSGKSSLLRAISGLWSAGSGNIVRPPLNEILFLPQRPYMVLGSLKSQLLYPEVNAEVSDAELQTVLEKVSLPDLANRVGGFDAVLNWQDILSLGEQQRVAFARLLLVKPKYAVLDEATSALDVKTEERLYRLLQASGITYISVGHRPSLTQYHQKIVELVGDSSWNTFPGAHLPVPAAVPISTAI